MSFKASDEKYVPFRSIDVPSTNGLTYSPTGNRVIQLEIPEFIGYFDPDSTFLKFDLELSGSPDPLVCRPHSAIHSLIQRVVIRDMMNGSLIEEIDDYNTLVATMMKYSNDDPERAKKCISEGTYFFGDTQSQQYWDAGANLANGAGAGPPTAGLAGSSGRAIGSAPSYNKNTFVAPLRTGLFNSKTIFPNKFVSGLRIELHLVDNARKALCKDTSLSYLSAPVNQAALAGGGGATAFPLMNKDLSGRGANAAAQAVAVIDEQDQTGCRPKFIDAQLQGASAQRPSVVSTGYFDGSQVATYTREKRAAGPLLQRGSFTAANSVIGSGGAAPQGVQVSTIAASTLANPLTEVNTTGGIQAVAHGQGALRLSTYNENQTADFTMSNVSMVVGEVLPSKEYEGAIARRVASGDGLSMDIQSYQVYKHTLASAITTQSIQLPIVNKRIYSILSVPTTQENYTDQSYLAGPGGANALVAPIAGTTLSHLDPYSHALNGMFDFWGKYHWSINGQIQPERSVDVSAVVPVNDAHNLQNQHHLFEIIKAMEGCGWDVRDLTDAKQYFLFAKAFARYGNTFNAVGKDIQLYIERTQVGDYNALIHSFVCHLRRLKITPSGLSVDA